ncbi:hypothetical protein ACJ72_08197 [Emergomyces africanus]|uniref:Uncharacterized protein n=1 Tax=Emergomyces africanus TaxID=1955775 RepID=A0A1B7NL41_9EURO|nr:hypothetical protein ACJ72_08197 [Emergomyces africanus]
MRCYRNIHYAITDISIFTSRRKEHQIPSMHFMSMRYSRNGIWS